ncbi:MAG: GNAT family N-acetyltransferase [Polaribacter sp.]|uniref:GNAT family N-acetyltransferase n=1 Tax=Polaribacter sp. TaxID=1920175 RepID=UPI002F3575D3
MKVIRTNSENKDFKNLVKQLDAYLKITDGDEHDFYNQFNHIDVLKNVVVFYIDEIAVGCGAIKKFDNASVEVKRMFVSEEKRGSGIAQNILTELEIWAKELGYKKCVLETGKRQIEAVNFYKKCKYNVIPNYGQYKGMENSVCFEKQL